MRQRPGVDWRVVRDLIIVGVVLVLLWVLILLFTVFLAGLIVDLLTKFDHAWNGH